MRSLSLTGARPSIWIASEEKFMGRVAFCLRHLRRLLSTRTRIGGNRRRQYCRGSEALYLSGIAPQVVTVVHRRDKFVRSRPDQTA